MDDWLSKGIPFALHQGLVTIERLYIFIYFDVVFSFVFCDSGDTRFFFPRVIT